VPATAQARIDDRSWAEPTQADLVLGMGFSSFRFIPYSPRSADSLGLNSGTLTEC